MRVEIAWSTNCRSSGSLVLRYSLTVGLPTPWVIRLWICWGSAAGMITAASAAPLRTLATASASE